ncbi:MAG: ATP-binding cassette domain-containing protein [Chloroflexi bacterium]|nr:ATP-binding cassette domain-containing protein [Chloroflexota bacterium]
MTAPVLAAPTLRPRGAAPALSARGLSKRFADVVAADNIDLDAYSGEILAILGENGAGKSTLMKMLYGYYHPDAGHLEVDGHAVRFHSPAGARASGIGMVFQNFTLIPALSVVENIALVQAGRGLRLDRRRLGRRISELSDRYQLEVRPNAIVRDLSVGERQRAEILKVLASDARILIMDEPTSVLAPHEVESLLGILRRLRDDGYAILLITHKMREVFACASQVTVLRRGRVIGGGPIGDFDADSLLRMMLGERQDQTAAVESPPAGPMGPGIRLEHVSTSGTDGRSALRDVSLSVPAGQIVGVAAVAGNGQSGLADVLIGIGKLKSGAVFLGGDNVTRASPARRLESGLCVVSEDPVAFGAVGAMSVSENFMLTRAPVDGKGRILRTRRLLAAAARLASRSPFPMPALGRKLETLSGGNVQRVVIVRELQSHCRFLLAYYPSRGLDVASSRAVQQMLVDLRAQGAAILLVSEDFDELRALSDEVLVLYHGEVVGTFGRSAVDPMRVGQLMTGGRAA